MNNYLAILVACVAIFSLNSNSVACYVNGEEVSEDPPLIEGTGGDDLIDCRDSKIDLEIYGYGGDDEIYGGEGHDFIAGGSGKDRIYGGKGNDAIDGGGNDDFIDGGEGNDLIFGGVGASPASGVGCTPQTTVFISMGSSYLTKGGSGDDTIYGGDGGDCIDAGSGEDMVYGGKGNDILEGGNHSDFLDGGLGNDSIDGGWHSDICIGGGGVDTFKNCESIGGSEPVCGDGICETNEDNCNCPDDCYLAPVDNELLLCNDNIDNDCDSYIDCNDIEDCGLDEVCYFSCEPLGSLCESNSDCCSNKCKGKRGSKTCK